MKIKDTLFLGLVILQTIACYIPNNSILNMKMDGMIPRLLISKRRDIIFYSIALNTLNIKKANAEQSIIDKVSTKDIMKYIEEEQANIFEK